MLEKTEEAVTMALEDFLTQIKEALNLLQSAVVNAILGGFSAVGINIPPFVIQLVLIGLMLFFFWKWVHRMPWLIAILLGLFLAAFLMGLFSGV